MVEAGAAGTDASDGHAALRYWPFIIALWITEMAGSFETAMIYSAQRALTQAFGDPVQVGWLVTSYLLVGAGAAALAGRLGDLFGRRFVLLAILACAACGSLLSAMAPNYTLVLVGRCIQGASGAILPLCIGLCRENVPAPRVPIVIGLMISGAAAGTAMGLLVGGFVTDMFGWQSVFLAGAVFAIIAMLALWLAVPPSTPAAPGGQLDWVGGILFVPSILLLLIPITYGRTWGLADARSLGCAAAGVLLILLWIRSSLRAANPLFDVRLFTNRSVALGNTVTALVAMSAMQIPLIFSLLLQSPVWTGIGLGVSATMAGLVMLPSNVSALAGGPLSGWLTSRGGGRITMVVGGVICVTGWLLTLAFHANIYQVGFVIVVVAFGTTILFAVGPTIIAAAVPHDRTSEAAGMMAVVRQAFLGIGAQLMTILLATHTIADPAGGARFPSSEAFMLAIGVIAALCTIATLLALALPRNAGLEPRE